MQKNRHLGTTTLSVYIFVTKAHIDNAKRDGRPAEYRCRPLFNAGKFG